ncbi:5628_t:CDS:2 [Acaulospora colombiana]|uniref:5628_t:CDS:1 n=1 Tax=Acaulospora colombiana TaxID=27376 RepID=A0ACA9LGQ8_9GLOM|nr:5628_t:CDS:2 [Acaulospora colombiana]
MVIHLTISGFSQSHNTGNNRFCDGKDFDLATTQYHELYRQLMTLLLHCRDSETVLTGVDFVLLGTGSNYMYPENPREKQFDYPFLDAKEELRDFEPPKDLIDFLDKKKRKPIYFGYGSMHSFGDAEGRVRLWLDVMKKLPQNQRAIFSGVSGVENSELTEGIQNKKIYVVNHIPHSWLFPKVACVVHHGGAGTTHAVVKAGVPSIVVPHFADQPWWASLLYRHGLTINSGIPAKSITSDKLYRALLDVLTDDDVIEKASVFGVRIRKDQRRDPVTKIVKYIESYWDSLNWDTLSLEDEKSYASSESS